VSTSDIDTRAASDADLEAVKEIARTRDAILEQVRKQIVGQDTVIEELLIALFSRAHALLVGVPGLAKTLLISTLADVLDLRFNRIQFTPDLMPSDITGTDVLEEDKTSGRRAFAFLKGPIFANVVLADEINRTPPKTQAALLQAMQEYKVTASGRTYPLDLPFFVLATQNPIEQEGTYPLPEAQLDRFMFEIGVDYPSREDELAIVKATTSAYRPAIDKVLDAEQILRLQGLVRRVPAADSVVAYAVALARASRPSAPDAAPFVKEWLSWGAGPRASQFLVLGGKARAILDGRYAVSVDDIRALAPSILRHRLVLNYRAESDGIRAPDVIARLLESVRPEQAAVAAGAR
jgi:MoxR-like ATPase